MCWYISIAFSDFVVGTSVLLKLGCYNYRLPGRSRDEKGAMGKGTKGKDG